MKKCILVFPVVFLLLAAEQGKKDAKAELKKFEGTWIPVSGKINGNKLPEDALKELKLTFKGNTVTRQTNDKTVKAIFQVDPNKEPKQFDAKGEEDGKEAKALGIYKFEDGKLTICSVRGRGKELKRPKEFSTKGGTKEAAVILVVLKKAKGE